MFANGVVDAILRQEIDDESYTIILLLMYDVWCFEIKQNDCQG